jgi:hypothetical protein
MSEKKLLNLTNPEEFLKEKAKEAQFILQTLNADTEICRKIENLEERVKIIVDNALTFKNPPPPVSSETLGYEIAEKHLSEEGGNLQNLYQEKYHNHPNPEETKQKWLDQKKIPKPEKRQIERN